LQQRFTPHPVRYTEIYTVVVRGWNRNTLPIPSDTLKYPLRFLPRRVEERRCERELLPIPSDTLKYPLRSLLLLVGRGDIVTEIYSP
jgi:hypothetical protein